MRVLLVVPQPVQAQSWNIFLKSEGFVAECAHTGEDALDHLRHYSFDLVLLDVVLPDMDGTLLISRMRTEAHSTPVLALISASNAKQRLAALSAGADDVFGQDIERAEVLARMSAVFRRSCGFSQAAIRCGGVALDQQRHDVTIDGQHLHFTKKEFAILQLLMMRRNTVMNKEAILANLYGGLDEPEIKIIDVFICKIRNKLARAGVGNLIQTVWGQGYVVRDDGLDNNGTPQPRIPAPVEARLRELVVA